ncbi:unnamed protein product [Caenorhabditis angaria]|uniref:CUB domain-containing protein n=1 Tax=Caenorhabditis angaria TaxID=860376 RepID=A0A9P1IV84_9PELO|nr:unnamed protein product [Caenorhabditis angaria]
MDIHYDFDCPKDRLMIGEGKQERLNILHTYCHTMVDKKNGYMDVDKFEDRFKQITSKSRYMTIDWVTDEINEAAGWVLEYQFVNEADTCGFHVKGMSGIVESPNYGVSDYPAKSQCIWDVQVPLGYHINLKFKDFDVEQSQNCTKDQLVVSELPNYLAKVPAGNYLFVLNDARDDPPLCGTNIPEYKETETTRIRLNFTTDEKVNGRGWRVEWEAKCGAIFESNHGVITAPNYPDGYPNENIECEYIIKADAKDVVALKFEDLDVSKFTTHYDRTPCKEDYIQILEYPSRRVVLTLCGETQIPDEALTIRGAVLIKFVSSRLFIGSDKTRKNDRGFKLAYNINFCGGDILLSNTTDLSAEIESPAFPLPYVRDLDCVWNITTSSDREINVKFEIMDLEEVSDCSADYIELFNSAETKNSLGKFCGGIKAMPTNIIRTTGPNLLIHMNTDHTIHSGGFKMIVTSSLGAKSGCGGNLIATEEWQTFSQPKDENGNYPGHLHCGWTIKAPVDHQIRLKINDIDTEKLQSLPGTPQKPFCTSDSLNIYDGLQNFSPILSGDICSGGNIPTSQIVSSGRYVYVYFVSDHGGSGRGINVSYSIEKANCGGWMKAEVESKSIRIKTDTSEEDGNHEKTHQRCKYMIEGNKTEPVIIHFKEFNIPSSDKNCEQSYVEIRDVGSINECQHAACAQQSAQRKVTRICGTRIPSPHISNTNVVQIIVNAQLRSGVRSLVAFDYQILDRCNRTIDTNSYRSGRITSPNYPNVYDGSSVCTTVLENSDDVTQSRKILIAFSKFVLETQNPNVPGSSDCSFDYLDIIDEGKSVGSSRICGDKVPPSIFTAGGARVATYFKTDHIINKEGYDATYLTVAQEKDDMIEFSDSYDLQGVVTNIGWPNGYNKSTRQIFVIRPPTSHTCIFNVEEVNVGVVENMDNCNSQDEYVELEVMYKSDKKSIRVRDCSYSKSSISANRVQMNGDDENRYFKIIFKSDDLSENDGRGFRVSWECDNYSN